MQQLSPSHLAKSLLAWTRQKPAREYAQEKVPVVHHEKYGVKEWNPAHRFVMSKFANAIEAIESNEILTDAVRFVEPPGPAPRSVVELVHAPEFVSAFIEGSLDPKAARKIGLPWSSGLVERTLYEVQGTLTAARLALEEGLACNNGGGTHHAFVDHGSGFTIFNDLAVTARALCTEGIVQKVLIVDLDVHQGDGTAAIFADDARVFTLSFHCGSNFPFKKQTSDLDVSLPDDLGDTDYLLELNRCLLPLLSEFKPDLVLYDAGVDVHESDSLGRLQLTDQGIFDRDFYVIRVCLQLGIPVATVIGGGYDADHKLLGARHAIIVQAAAAASRAARFHVAAAAPAESTQMG